MNSTFRLIIAFLIFATSGFICSLIPDEYQIFSWWFYPGAIIFGIAYILAHIIVLDKNILREKLLASTLFVIFGTQISCGIAVFSSIPFTFLDMDMPTFPYLVGNVAAALTLFMIWRILIPLNNKVSALLQTLLAAGVAFLVTSAFGFDYTYESGWFSFGESAWPKSMLVFFMSWQVLVGMTLLHVAKRYQKNEASPVNPASI